MLTTLPRAGQPPTAKDDLIKESAIAPLRNCSFLLADWFPSPKWGIVNNRGGLFICVCFWVAGSSISMSTNSLAAATGGYSLLWFLGSLLWGFSCFRAQTLGTRASTVVAALRLSSCGSQALWAQTLWCMDLVPLWHVGSSQTKD